MNTAPTASTARTLAAGVVVITLGCATDFDPGWLIKHYRVLGARIENVTRQPTDPGAVEAAPGERMHLSLVQVDPAVPARPLQAVWVFCANVARAGNSFGCAGAGAGAQVAMGTEVDYTVPAMHFGVGGDYHPTITALSYSCAGGTIAVDPTNPAPRCTGDGAEGWLMTRTITVRTSESVPINHLPRIADVVIYPGVDTAAAAVTLDPAAPLHVPHCTVPGGCADRVVEIHPAADAREHYLDFNNSAQRVDMVEKLQFGFTTTAGTLDGLFRVDTDQTPAGPIRNTWTTPGTPGTVTFVFTAQDTRGGFDATIRTVVVE